MQPLVLSPKVWMWKPRLALGSLPVMSQVILVGADSDSCSKTTVPVTLESPRRTLTAEGLAELNHPYSSTTDVMGSCRAIKGHPVPRRRVGLRPSGSPELSNEATQKLAQTSSTRP